MKDTERQKHRQREKQATAGSLMQDSILGTRGSQPEPKADAQPLSHPGAQCMAFCRLSSTAHLRGESTFSGLRSSDLCVAPGRGRHEFDGLPLVLFLINTRPLILVYVLPK